ncbi:sterile alpha motif domain-containing protein 14 isoform X1 [Mirounga leonina]|nr:sterile alpha motif domain-containing protein 14 isoform X1 [Mirounga leonina]
MRGLDLIISQDFSQGCCWTVYDDHFEGMLMMERPQTLKCVCVSGGSSVSHVNAHSKSAWTKIPGLSLCLHPGFASAPTLLLLPPAPFPPSGVWFRQFLFQGAGGRVLREGEGPEGQEQAARGSSLVSLHQPEPLIHGLSLSLSALLRSPQLSCVMASSKLREPADEVFDLDLAVPETVRLDSSLHKARAQLLAKGRRHRPSRSRLRDSASSAEDGEGSDGPGGKVTDGCGSPLHRLRSPLHSGPGSPAGGSFCLEPPGLRRSLDEDEPPPSPLTRYRPLHNAASHEGLAAASCSPPRSAPSSDSSPSFVRRHPRAEPHSEDDSRDASPPEPASPTIGLDKKTRRKFLDLGVTLRRASTSKSRKDKGSNRLSMGSRESVEGSGRSGGSPFLPFSWFTDSGKGSASSGSTTSPACSPKHEGFSPKKSASQESTLSDDSTPPSSSPKIPSGPRQETKCSYPYHTLSQSSDEFLDEPLPTVHHWTSQQVGQWLHSLSLEQYAAEFAARQVDGRRLLQLDGSKLKSLGLSNSHDRTLVKRKVKELAAAAEKERKAQEKAARQREKLRRREQEAKKS